MTHAGLSRTLAALTASIALLAGCGGGSSGTQAGVGTGGSGYSIGTVTGFGSIIIDGTAWNDTAAVVQVERDPRAGAVATQVQLGQRVQVEYDDEPQARVISVEPAVIGTIEAVLGGTPLQVRVAGQTVRINLDPDGGPVTLFAGSAGAATLAAGQNVEVHGVPIASGGSYAIQASRIERLAALPAGLVRVQNVVQQANSAARTFQLGGVTVSTASATVLPAGAAVANGKVVTVWAAPPAGALTTLAAAVVRVRDLSNNAKPTELSGVVGGLNTVTRSFDIAGVPVLGAGAVVVPASQTLANGQFVVARGRFLADGSFDATQVRIRKKGFPGFDYEVALTGPITDFASLAEFRVRGVTVDATQATLRACNNVVLGNAVNVEVGGAIVGDRVVAELLTCR